MFPVRTGIAQALLILDHTQFSLCSSRPQVKSSTVKASLLNSLEGIKMSSNVFWWQPCLWGFRIFHPGVCNLEKVRKCWNRKSMHWETASSNNVQLQLLVLHTKYLVVYGSVYPQGIHHTRILSFKIQIFFSFCIIASARSNIPLVCAGGEGSFWQSGKSLSPRRWLTTGIDSPRRLAQHQAYLSSSVWTMLVGTLWDSWGVLCKARRWTLWS